MTHHPTKSPGGVRSGGYSGVVWAVCGTLAVAFFVGWRVELDKRNEVLSAEWTGAEREWAALARAMPDAERARDHFRALLARPKRLEADRAAPRWTWALRTIVAAREGDIELHGLHARQMTDAPGACELRIDGLSFGPDARITADRFRLKIEQLLQRGQSGAPVKTGFLRFADESESPSAPSNQPRLTFEIVATVGIKDPAIFKRSLRY